MLLSHSWKRLILGPQLALVGSLQKVKKSKMNHRTFDEIRTDIDGVVGCIRSSTEMVCGRDPRQAETIDELGGLDWKWNRSGRHSLTFAVEGTIGYCNC